MDEEPVCVELRQRIEHLYGQVAVDVVGRWILCKHRQHDIDSESFTMDTILRRAAEPWSEASSAAA